MLFGKLLLIAGTTAVAASSALAQESASVGTAKVASKLTDLVSSQTGNVQLRSYANETHEDKRPSKKEGNSTITQVRANLTLNTFKDKVSSTLTLGASSESENEGQITQRRPRLLTTVNAYDSAYFGVVPYLDLHGPQTAPGTRGDLGLTPTLKHPAIKTAIGDLSFSAYVEAEAQFSSRKEDSRYRTNADEDRRKDFGLVDEKGNDKETVDGEKGITYDVTYVPGVALDMERVVPGLSLATYLEYYNTFEQVLEYNDDGSDNPETKRVYEATRDTTTYFDVTYKVTPALSLLNSFALGHKDFYASRGDRERARFTNLAMLSYKIY